LYICWKAQSISFCAVLGVIDRSRPLSPAEQSFHCRLEQHAPRA
jgi:hypothetical protein